VFPLRHRQCVIGRQQAAPHEQAQQAPAHLRLDFGEGGGIEPGDGMEDDLARRGRVEHAVDDDTMEVEVRVEGGTEAVDAKAPVVCSPTGDCCTMESLIES
jgi:hypothetical protein